MKGEYMAAKKQNVHYVNNAEFSQAVVDYVTTVNEAKDKNIYIYYFIKL